MGEWYWIGLLVGVGAGFGVLFTGVLSTVRGGVVAALGLIPGVGYLEALALPALGARIRRRGGERYAGLRILARD